MPLPRRGLDLCVALVLWAAALRAQTPSVPAIKASSADETCVVSGMVIAKTDSTPLKGATVQLWSDDDNEHTIAAKSAADGRFELRNVPAGKYRLGVSRNGYFEAQYGQTKPSEPGATFSLRSGQHMTDLLFKLGRAGVISGRIFDQDGEPMAKVMVMVLRNIYKNGRQELGPVSQSESNDLGEFRLYGLSPGRYYVSAQDAAWNQVVGEPEFSGDSKAGGEKGYTKLYYPNALDPGKAAPLIVKEGEEIPSIDFLMKEIAVYRIRGRIVNLATKHGMRNAQVQILRRNEGSEWMDFNDNGSPKPDGAFDIPQMAPGEYTVLAMLFDEGKLYTALQDVDVVSADIDGLLLTVTAGITIPGKVNWDGKPSLMRDEVWISLESEQAKFGIGSKRTNPDDNWQFTLKEVADGTYKVRLTGLSKDCYIKEVRYGDSAVPDTEFRVKGAGGDLEVSVSSQGARAGGTVLNPESLPAPGVWVVVVPEESKRKFLRLYKSVLTDQYGHFEIHGLAPGKYKLFSWQGVEENAWQDPEFLKDYESKGEAIEVQDRDQKSIDLKLIQAKD
jgi:carboxypeptidase family protein